MTEEESTKALAEKDTIIAALQANTTSLEAQIQQIAQDLQNAMVDRDEAVAAKQNLAKLVQTSDPRLENLTRANALLKNQVTVLTRLHEMAQLRARGGVAKPVDA